MLNPIMASLGNGATTANGALSYASTGSSCLDFFSKVGSARLMDDSALKNLFYQAALEDIDVATRIMMWARDCRGGAGERATFRKLLVEFESWCMQAPEANSAIMNRVIEKTVELGRWDDLFCLTGMFDLVIPKIAEGIKNNDQLLLKWLPREKSAKSAIARRIMLALSLTPKQYRKICSGVVTAETLMCAKKWDQINLSHLPSVASTRYQKAMAKNHPGYEAWKAGLVAGTEKVNAAVSFPHDVWRACKASTAPTVIDAMWEALPNYIPEGMSILPISDTSSSMECPASGSVTCLDISISLGAYLATKNTGPFAGALLTFNTEPEFHFMGNKSISQELIKIKNMSCGGSTDFQKTFDLILKHAIRVNAKPEEMPQIVLCLSDMQFNQAERNYGYSKVQSTNYDAIAQKFADAGYKLPKLVFWNLNARDRETPATAAHNNVALVSGFSPAILKSVLADTDFKPISIMHETVMQDRYKVV